MPEITVIIPVWNGEQDLSHCLRALEAQTLAREAFEVLVVDNGSTDSTAAVARGFAGVRVLDEPAPGSYNARNTGLAAAQGRYVAFTDADCRPTPDWLGEALSACRANSDAGVVGGRIDLFGETDRPSLAELYERTFAFRQDEVIASGRCTTANWISPRVVLEGLGGFDGALKSGGDYALSLRIAASGKAMIYEDRMVVLHPARATLAALAKKRRRTVGGRWTMFSGGARGLKIMVRGFRNSARALKRVSVARDLSPGQALGVSGVVGVLALVEIVEIIRLTFGKPATRS